MRCSGSVRTAMAGLPTCISTSRQSQRTFLSRRSCSSAPWDEQRRMSHPEQWKDLKVEPGRGDHHRQTRAVVHAAELRRLKQEPFSHRCVVARYLRASTAQPPILAKTKSIRHQHAPKISTRGKVFSMGNPKVHYYLTRRPETKYIYKCSIQGGGRGLLSAVILARTNRAPHETSHHPIRSCSAIQANSSSAPPRSPRLNSQFPPRRTQRNAESDDSAAQRPAHRPRLAHLAVRVVLPPGKHS